MSGDHDTNDGLAANGLTFDLDVEACVVGAGVAGLTAARELARAGLSVAVLEGRRIGWSASGHHLGTVLQGYNLAPDDLIARVGLQAARELWALADAGAEALRVLATEGTVAGLNLTEGALEVSAVDNGDHLVRRLQLLNEQLGAEAEGWPMDRVRAAIGSLRYFHAIHYPKAFQISPQGLVEGLAALARADGVRIFENTPLVSLDAAGVRKRLVTPSARIRATHVVLAGSVHLGASFRRLSETLLPIWRHAGVAQLSEAARPEIEFAGSVVDADRIDHFRRLEGDKLIWSSGETTWPTSPRPIKPLVRKRMRAVYPVLQNTALDEVWSAPYAQTVHGMPQIGELRSGLWVASGFGHFGLHTAVMAGHLVAAGVAVNDDRWRRFEPFELVWAGGVAGRAVGQAFIGWTHGVAAVTSALSRRNERARQQGALREARLASANRSARNASRLPPRGPSGPVRPSIHDPDRPAGG
jgi:glycine/D-amino acid oxidase-like deaminating enzyme